MRRRVAVLGASGLVAQRFQQRLAHHPWFELALVAGSSDTAGRSLGDLPWRLEEERPEMPDLVVQNGDVDNLVSQLKKENCQLVFSALPSDVAGPLEPALRDAGFAVFSNSSAHRHSVGVPLVVADLNPHHLQTLKIPPNRSGSGMLACSTNCTVIAVALPLKPVWDMIGIRGVRVRTAQALSGGGWALLESAKSSGRVSPDIPGEAETISRETKALLGRVSQDGIRPAGFPVEVECQRVLRDHGHLVDVEVELSQEPARGEVEEWMRQYRARPQALDLPSAPAKPFVVLDEALEAETHRWMGAEGTADPASDLRAGMSVSVTGLEVEGKRMRFSALVDNTIRGAAGGCVLLAELTIAEGLISG